MTINIDTNVLVRAILADHPHETAIAQQLLSQVAADKKFFISSYAILEMVWVLKVKGKSQSQIIEVLLDFLDSPGVTIGQREILVTAFEIYRQSKVDFGDCLILAEGGAYNTHRLASFDKALCKERNDYCQHPEKFLKTHHKVCLDTEVS